MVLAGGVSMARVDGNIRQRNDQLRTVAALANVGRAAQALKVLGDKVVESGNPAVQAAEMWLELSEAERAVTAVVAEIRLGHGVYAVSQVFANGEVEVQAASGRRISFSPQAIDPTITRERLELSKLESLKIHEGDRIRWTANDKDRGLFNSALANVVAIDEKGVTVETAAKRSAHENADDQRTNEGKKGNVRASRTAGREAIQRLPSWAMPPPGTIM